MSKGYPLRSQTVVEIGQMQITGNVVPISWLARITHKKSGNPHLLAVMLLSEIIYWHRPIEDRDEDTRQQLPARQKFAGDYWQSSYEQMAAQFGVEKRTLQEAAYRLKELGLIRIHLFSKEINGVTLYNLTHFEPVVEAVREITYAHFRRDTSHIRAEGVSRQDVTPLTAGCETEYLDSPSDFPERESTPAPRHSHETTQAGRSETSLKAHLALATTPSRDNSIQNPRPPVPASPPPPETGDLRGPMDDFGGPAAPELDAPLKAILRVCKINPDTAVEWQVREAKGTRAALRKAGATPQDLKLFPAYWDELCLKRKRYASLRPSYIQEHWGEYQAWLDSDDTEAAA